MTRYEDVNFVLRDPRFGQDIQHLLLKKYRYDSGILQEPSSVALSNLIIMKEPPDHTRIRRLIVKAFARSRVEKIMPRIKMIANDLIDKFESKRCVDLILSCIQNAINRILNCLLSIMPSNQ